MTDDMAVGQTQRRRPFFAWVILTWVVFGAISLVAGYVVLLGVIPAVDSETLARMRSIGWPHWALSVIGGILNVSGAIQLIRMKAIAGPLFAGVLLVILLDSAYLYVSGTLETAFPHIGPFLIGIVIAAMIVGYTYNLRARERLT